MNVDEEKISHQHVVRKHAHHGNQDERSHGDVVHDVGA
jgi:hypothetical protein